MSMMALLVVLDVLKNGKDGTDCSDAPIFREGRDRIDPEARQRTILLDWALWVPEMICRAIGILLILSAAFSFFF